MKRFIVIITIILLFTYGCIDITETGSKSTGGVSMSYDGVRRRFANLPFNKRTDIVTVYWQLQNAFSRIRTRIDTEFGSKEWKDIDPPIQSFPECDEEKNTGRNTISKQGAFFGTRNEDFPRLKQIVQEEVRPYGFTEIADVSDNDVFWVDFYNIKDGGYIGISMTKDKFYFGMMYNTDCRPVQRGLDPETSRVVPGDGLPSGTGSSTAPNVSPSS